MAVRFLHTGKWRWRYAPLARGTVTHNSAPLALPEPCLVTGYRFWFDVLCASLPIMLSKCYFAFCMHSLDLLQLHLATGLALPQYYMEGP